MTARIEVREGEAKSEVVATRVDMFWNPLTDGGQVVFHMTKLVTVDGDPVSMEPLEMLTIPLADIIDRTWEVPDGQGGTIPVPTLLVMGVLKEAFDRLYNEIVAAPEEPDPEPTFPTDPPGFVEPPLDPPTED